MKYSMKALVFVIFSLLWVSCSPSIRNIKSNPKNYAGKSLSINAEVIRAYNIPFTEIFLYEVYDHSDTMLVVSVRKPQRRNGDKVLFKGRIFFLSGNRVNDVGNGLLDAIVQILTDNGVISGTKAKKVAKTVVRFMNKVLKDRNLFVVMVET